VCVFPEAISLSSNIMWPSKIRTAPSREISVSFWSFVDLMGILYNTCISSKTYVTGYYQFVVLRSLLIMRHKILFTYLPTYLLTYFLPPFLLYVIMLPFWWISWLAHYTHVSLIHYTYTYISRTCMTACLPCMFNTSYFVHLLHKSNECMSFLNIEYLYSP